MIITISFLLIFSIYFGNIEKNMIETQSDQIAYSSDSYLISISKDNEKAGSFSLPKCQRR